MFRLDNSGIHKLNESIISLYCLQGMDSENINASVQHNRISSSSNMDHMEPPNKRSKVESGGVEAEPNSQVSKESGNAWSTDTAMQFGNLACRIKVDLRNI